MLVVMCQQKTFIVKSLILIDYVALQMAVVKPSDEYIRRYGEDFL